jgi:hypothetical protein
MLAMSGYKLPTCRTAARSRGRKQGNVVAPGAAGLPRAAPGARLSQAVQSPAAMLSADAKLPARRYGTSLSAPPPWPTR